MGPSGTKERASRALGEYPPGLNRLLAESTDKIRPRVQRLARLRAEPIPRGEFHTPVNDRDRENLAAIGGMRNPHLSIARIPKAKLIGPMVYDILKSASPPSVDNLVSNLLGGKPATPVSTALLRALVVDILAEWTTSQDLQDPVSALGGGLLLSTRTPTC